jgi:predicted kinase
MRRRSRRSVNLSEQTGKIGQELPQNQPRPLVPSYSDEPQVQRGAARAESVPVKPKAAEKTPEKAPAAEKSRGFSLFKKSAPAIPAIPSIPNDKRYELETQPEHTSASAAIREAAAKDPSAPKGYVVLAIGLPGSGKTTWFNRRGVTPLSSDLLRNILFDDVEEQRYQGLVFSTLRSLLRARLIAHMPWNYVDATNLSTHERRQWIKMASSFGYETHAVFFDVPLEVCLERNSKRDRNVNAEVMKKMAERLKPPVFEEGFAKIIVVRMKNA